MNWPKFSLKQLFFSIFLMSVGMAGITFAARFLDRRSAEWAASTVLGSVVVVTGAILLVAKRRRILALIWVLLAVLLGLIVGGIVATSAVPGVNQRYLTPEEDRLAQIIAHSSAAAGALVGFISLTISSMYSKKFSDTRDSQS